MDSYAGSMEISSQENPDCGLEWFIPKSQKELEDYYDWIRENTLPIYEFEKLGETWE